MNCLTRVMLRFLFAGVCELMFLNALSSDIYAGVYSRMILSPLYFPVLTRNKLDLMDLGGPPGVVGACDALVLAVE